MEEHHWSSLVKPEVKLRVVRNDPADIAEAARLFREYATWLNVDLCFQGFEEELAKLPSPYQPEEGGELILVSLGEATKAVACVAVHSWHDEEQSNQLPSSSEGKSELVPCSPYGKVCEMKRLWVDTSAQGKGLGRMLVGAIKAISASLGYVVQRLDTLERLEAAIALYEKTGFSRRTPYRPNPLEGPVFMEAPLSIPTPTGMHVRLVCVDTDAAAIKSFLAKSAPTTSLDDDFVGVVLGLSIDSDGSSGEVVSMLLNDGNVIGDERLKTSMGLVRLTVQSLMLKKE